ncbi:hypothetical protein F4861DRAFT_506074 [Xylaria intraflava]|nr:hypothetical protein F4861DRAFT_506074 [Xylaria intraflava]
MSPAQSNYSSTSGITPSHLDRMVRKSTGWHGSWSRVPKSAASTEVARENIMASEQNKAYLPSNSDSQSTKTLRIITETNIEARRNEPVSSVQQPEVVNAGDDSGQIAAADEPTVPNQDLDKSCMSIPSKDTAKASSGSTGWLSWLSRSATVQVECGNKNDSAGSPGAALETTQEMQPQDSEDQAPLSSPLPPPAEALEPTKSTSSWFTVWPLSANPTTRKCVEQEFANKDIMVEEDKAKESENVAAQNVHISSTPIPQVTQPRAGSTWVFWSRDTAARRASESGSSAERGELAVTGDGSETSPGTSSVVGVNEGSGKETGSPIKSSKEQLLKSTPTKATRGSRPQSMDIDQPCPGSPSVPSTLPSKSTTASTLEAVAPNLLLPSFKSTYRIKENPSIINKITRLLLRTQQSPANRVFLSRETPRIKKAIAIGVHGLFPATYLRPMIGQPTGTSIRFAEHCVEAIRRWTESNGSGDCEIEKVALVGEGKIADRVDNLWKLLLSWIEHIKNADLIMLACHSQGVPVSIMLLAQLIDLGVITNSRVGLCAMAGVSLGPFPDYNKSGMGMLMGSVAELWQFADPESEISKRYEHALKTVVDHGVRITYVGSIDDQLVPLESALYGPASHPYIYRAVFIDGRVHAPDFIAHLIGFALKLRNLGISDHGLIRELSLPLAGSLYSGGGHSRLYDDGQVYDLAIMHALETSSVSGVPCHVQRYQGLANSNPYILPWTMRGLLEEEIVKTELHPETVDLLKQFDDWAPTTKALKDVKYRLEAIRSKL